MAYSLRKLSRDKLSQYTNSANGEVLSETEDPYALMNEFSSLYSEKIKAIEENCEDPTEAKIRTLQDWVNDLTEQNYVLIKTVEELEIEALNRVSAVSSLAEEAKQTMHKDVVNQGAKNDMRDFDEKVSLLQDVIEENNDSLEACMKEIDELSKKLAEKSEECNKLRSQNLRLQGLREGVQGLQEDLDSTIELSQFKKINKNKTHEMTVAEKSLEELKKEAARIKKELEEKTKILQSPEAKSETLLEEIADYTHRLHEVRGRIATLEDIIRENSEVTKSIIKESKKALDEFQTFERFQNYYDETEALSKTSLEDKISKRRAHSKSPRAETSINGVDITRYEEAETEDIESSEGRKSRALLQSVLSKNPRAETLIKAADKTRKDLKTKTEVLETPEGKKNRTLTYETAVTVIRFEDLKGEIRNLPVRIVTDPTDESEDPIRIVKSMYDEPSTSMFRDLDLEDDSNIILPLGRAERFLNESRLALTRLQELEKELEKVKISINKNSEALRSSAGRRNAILLKNAAVDAMNLHDWEEELSSIERGLRERTETILSILEEDPAAQFDRFQELQNELETAQKELKEKTETLRTSQGRIEALVNESQNAAGRLLEMRNTVNKLEDELKGKQDLLSRADPVVFQKEMNKKEDVIINLQQSLEKAKADLVKKEEQISFERKQKEAIEEEINKMKSSGDSSLMKLKVSDLEKQLKEKKCELAEQWTQNQQYETEIKTLETTIEKVKHDYNEMSCKYKKTEELLQKSCRRETAFKSEICRLQKEIECYQIRIQKQEQRTKLLEEQLEVLQTCSSYDDPNRSQEFNEQIRCLLSTIKNKDLEIEKHIEQEKQLCFQISKMEHCVKERDRQMSLMSENMKKISCELRAKSHQLEKMEEENARNNLQTINNASDNRYINCTGCKYKTKDLNVFEIGAKLKDMQEALTAEIADKHDEIRRLKDDVKELEDKLLQSDKQTQFRDDIIKELRKEVKMGRAKESLAEMLGLKGTPRALMKNRIENLTGQMEEMRTHIISLEARLAECNLPAVLSLRSRLNNAEGSLLAMCNKMDYVRRYLENLKGDEQLSMKCGLEALLNELRDDVEWNRQTRRNLSLDEGTSVIVISHRSRSLPDNSLHRLPSKTQSESAVTSNKQLATNFHQSLDTFQECKNYIHTINELESDFDETDRAILNTWNSLKLWSQNSGDSVLNDFSTIIKLCLQGNETLSKLAAQVGKTLDKKVDQDNGCNIAYLEGNLIELGRYLTKANIIAPPSDSDVSKEEIVDEKASLSKKISDVISDSLSLVNDMKRNSNAQVPLHVKECLQDLMVSFSSILGCKKHFLEKLVGLQKQQVEFLKNLLARVSEFDSGMSSYHDIAENLKNEIRKLFSVLLTKENQIQKQYDEINNLKALLSSTDRSEHTYDEVSSLRKVVSNKDLQLIEKDEMIHNLRSLNYTLRRTKSSRSSPSVNTSTDHGSNLEEKMQQLEDCMLNIKGNLSSVFLYLVKNQEKLTVFEEDARSLVQVLAKTHQEISHYREISSEGKGDSFDISSMVENLDNAASKVEQLINVVEIFLCDSEKLDLNFISEVLRRKLMKLIYIAEFIKKSAIQEHTSIKNVVGEKEDFKKQGSNKDEVIKTLTDNLKKAHNELQLLQDEYSHLKNQKEDMELKNQKVMEELQAKISNLQEAASCIQTTDSVSNKSWLFPWPQSR